MKMRKAVFPVAGLGTRFLPATKAVPKELLPVVDKPLIQYTTEEAVRAGVTELIFIVSRLKNAIQDHFDMAYELEMELQRKGKVELLDTVRAIVPSGVSCSFVRQSEARGLGHAVACAGPTVGNEPFAVLLPDDLIDDPDRGCLAQMAEVFREKQGSVIAVEPVPKDETHRYGIVSARLFEGNLAKMEGIVEKPEPGHAPSNLAVVGRYIFTPRLFDCLKRTQPGAGGEIQLTDAVALLLQEEDVYAFRFEGHRYDCGSKLGMLQATYAMALRDPEVGHHFAAHVESSRGGRKRRG